MPPPRGLATDRPQTIPQLKGEVMTLKTLVENAKKKNPALKDMRDPKAVALLRAVFGQLVSQVESAKDGDVVKVPGLGNFRARMVEREKGGQKVTEKRVVFRAAKPGKPKGKAKA